MTDLKAISGQSNAVDPRVLKQLLLSQFTTSIDPFTNNTTNSVTGQNSGAFGQLLSQLMNNGLSISGSDAGDDDMSFGSLGLTDRYMGLSDSSANLLAWTGAAGSGTGLSTDLHSSTSAYDGLISQAAARYGLDPALIKGVIQTESSFQPNAGSSAGAKGLMQLMDGTASGLGVTDVFDPLQNIDGGSRFLAYLMRKYDGNEMTALAAYNAGPGRVDRLGLHTNSDVASRLSELPQETQAYIGKVLAARQSWSASSR